MNIELDDKLLDVDAYLATRGDEVAKRDASKLSASCVMAMVEPAQAKAFIEFGKQIPDSELYTGDGDADSYGPDYGRENECHATILYGITGSDPEPVRAIAEKYEPFLMVCGRVAMFAAAERNKPYDVVYCPVYSSTARKMWKKFKTLPYENEFDQSWVGHITIAYVKAGEGAKYAGDRRFSGRQIWVHRLCFSTPDNGKTMIDLAAEPVGKDADFERKHPRLHGKFTDRRDAGAMPVRILGVASRDIDTGVIYAAHNAMDKHWDTNVQAHDAQMQAGSPLSDLEPGYVLTDGSYIDRDEAERRFGSRESIDLREAGAFVKPSEFVTLGKDIKFESDHPRGEHGRFKHLDEATEMRGGPVKIVGVANRNLRTGSIGVAQDWDDIHWNAWVKSGQSLERDAAHIEAGYLLTDGEFITRKEAEDKFGYSESTDLKSHGAFVEPSEFAAAKEVALSKAYDPDELRDAHGRWVKEVFGDQTEVTSHAYEADRWTVRDAISFAVKRAGLQEFVKTTPLRSFTVANDWDSLRQTDLSKIAHDELTTDYTKTIGGAHIWGRNRDTGKNFGEVYVVLHPNDMVYGDGRLKIFKENSTTNAARNTSNLVAIATVHELSHQLHRFAPDSVKEMIRSVWQKYQDAARGLGDSRLKPVTQYAGLKKDNDDEWFAETHTAYVMWPKILEPNDRFAFEKIKEIRTALGLKG